MDFSGSTKGPHSSALPESARVTNMHLELMVDFEQSVLTGAAILTIERIKPIINHIILDYLGLVISSVTNAFDGTPLRDQKIIIPTSGTAICVDLPPITSGTTYVPDCKIRIEYRTTPDSFALYWLTPEQTANNGRHHFLLSNNKLNYARSWFPCQDTPSVKFTYSAAISVQRPYRVLMSALSEGIRKDPERPELDVHVFRQKNRVPSYAVVIAVGSLWTKQFENKRISIIAEGNTFQSLYVGNFRYTVIESMLQIATDLCGPYVWGEYNICVLPLSIADFEIECPCVTFVSPTLLGGDRFYVCCSLARNISQSWAGNLVTCCNYEHLWLNKSLSIFISRRIKRNVLFHGDIDIFLLREGLRNLTSLVQESKNGGNLTCLLPKLGDLSHDVATKYYVPYEKGYFLLCHIQAILGGPTAFEPFLKSYFNKFAFRSINTVDFKTHLYEQFPNNKEMLDGVDWQLWFEDASCTPIVLNLLQMSSWESEDEIFVDNWIKWDGRACNVPPMRKSEYRLNNVRKIMLLDNLHSVHSRLTTEKLDYIYDRYFRINRNKKIEFLWLLLCIKVRKADEVTRALIFATEYCSPNYACPIFQHLYEWEEKREEAIEAYNSNREKMLNKTWIKIGQILHQNL